MSAAGVVGEITSTSPGSFSAGVRGINNGTGGSGIGVWGSQEGIGWGVYGTSMDGTGVRGTCYGTGSGGNGVWGSHQDTGYGVYGTSTAGAGVHGKVLGTLGDGVSGYGIGNLAYAGWFDGNVSVRGNLTAWSKDFVQPHPTDPGKQIVYVCLEGGENGVYVRGSGQLESGRAEIELPEHFALVAAEEGLTAQITPRGGNALGYLYVEEVLPDHVVVAESGGGTSDARFDYLVMGVRRGFEEHKVIRENDLMKPDRRMSQEEYEKWMGLKKNRGMQKLLIENGTLTPEGKINQKTAAKLNWKLGSKTREGTFQEMSPGVPKGAGEGEQPAGDLP